MTISIAMMLCHRFYIRQSHAKNDWQVCSVIFGNFQSEIEVLRTYALGFDIPGIRHLNCWLKNVLSYFS